MASGISATSMVASARRRELILLAGGGERRVPTHEGEVRMCVQTMREEAVRYRRLASATDDPTLTAELEAKACAFEERAVQLEAAKRSLGLLQDDAS